jgi:hypothetical protein
MFAALHPAFYAVTGGLLLFGLIVVVRFATGLAKDAKVVAGRVRSATERLGESLEELSAESGRASRSMERIRRTRERTGRV